MIESELINERTFLVKVTLKIDQEKCLLLILFCKLIPGHKKLKIQTEKR